MIEDSLIVPIILVTGISLIIAWLGFAIGFSMRSQKKTKINQDKYN